jgi:hypothetical protein
VPFRLLLGELVEALPGARGAVFCDYEGESVDLFVAAPQPPGCGPLSEFDLKICGAQLTAVWTLLAERSLEHGAGRVDALHLHTDHGALLCAAVKDGYYVTLLLSPRAATAAARRRLGLLAHRFALEM